MIPSSRVPLKTLPKNITRLINNMFSSSATEGLLTLDVAEKRIKAWLRPDLFAEPWDNVGILIGSVQDKVDKVIKRIHVCNDLTPGVVEEAIAAQADMIVTYHPLLFKPIKAVAYGTWNERVVVKCLANDIVVYSPHTALDAVVGGVNDHFVHILSKLSAGLKVRPISSKYSKALREVDATSNQDFLEQMSVGGCAMFGFDLFEDNSSDEGQKNKVRLAYTDDFFDESCDEFRSTSAVEHALIANHVEMKKQISPSFWPGAGRYVVLETAVPLLKIIESFKTGFWLPYVQVAGNNEVTREISRIGICAGSGASLLKDCPPETECVITGEMSHHEILDFVHGGKAGSRTALLFGHCASERHYLKFLAKALRLVLTIGGETPEVYVSKADVSPLSLA